MYFPVLAISAWALLAQNSGTITGMVTDIYGGVLGKAAIQATNVATKAVFKAESSATGAYTLAQLPAGTYDLSATVTGMARFEQKNIAVGVAHTVQLNIKVNDFSLNTVGEDRQFFEGLTTRHKTRRTDASHDQRQTGFVGSVVGHIPSGFGQAGTDALRASHRQRACREPP